MQVQPLVGELRSYMLHGVANPLPPKKPKQTEKPKTPHPPVMATFLKKTSASFKHWLGFYFCQTKSSSLVLHTRCITGNCTDDQGSCESWVQSTGTARQTHTRTLSGLISGNRMARTQSSLHFLTAGGWDKRARLQMSLQGSETRSTAVGPVRSAGTCDPLPECLCLHLDRHLLQQQHTKKLSGTKRDCTHAQLGQLWTRCKRATNPAPPLRCWESKQGPGHSTRTQHHQEGEQTTWTTPPVQPTHLPLPSSPLRNQLGPHFGTCYLFSLPWGAAWVPVKPCLNLSSGLLISFYWLQNSRTQVGNIYDRCGFPGGSAGKESTCNAGDPGLIPGLGRSPGKGRGYPRQDSGLQNSMDCIAYGVAKRHDRVTFTFHDGCGSRLNATTSTHVVPRFYSTSSQHTSLKSSSGWCLNLSLKRT